MLGGRSRLDGGAGREAVGRRRALVVVHDIDIDLGLAEAGTIGERLARHDLDPEIVVAGTPLPPPGELGLCVVMGSGESAYDDSVPWVPGELAYVRSCVTVGTPVLGICFGGQLLARALGAAVRRAERPELGFRTVDTAAPGMVGPGPWMEFHFDTFDIPLGAVGLAWTPDAPQAFSYGPHLGTQFHPEITPAAFEAWVGVWQASGFVDELPRLGVDLTAMRTEIAARADAARAQSYALFDAFWLRVQSLGTAAA